MRSAPDALCFARGILAVATLWGASCMQETTVPPDGSAQNPLPLEMRADVPEDFLTPVTPSLHIWTSGERLVIKGPWESAAAARFLRVAARTQFVDAAQPELPVYLRWEGPPLVEGPSSPVEIDLRPALALHNRVFGPRKPWSMRIVTRHDAPQSPAWVSRVVAFPTPEIIEWCGTIDTDNIEADRMAAWLHRADPVEADPGRIRREMYAIRTANRQISDLFLVYFTAPGSSGRVRVRFEPAIASAVRLGTFDGWRAAGSIPSTQSSRVGAEWFEVAISQDAPLCDEMAHFTAIPGVLAVDASPANDGSTVYPYESAGVRTYLFRRAGGDCSGRCTENHYWYFVPDGDGHRLMGDWVESPGVEPPSWWPEARRNIDLYASWLADCHTGTP